MKDLKIKAKNSFYWSVIIQFSNQLFGFIVSIILARILFPEDFGLIGMIGIFIFLGRILLDGGLASSLIRNKEVDDCDYSTVFYTNVLTGLLIYLLLYSTAPFISLFFGEIRLVELIRIYAIVLVIGSFSIVQSVKLNKSLQFKTQFKLILPSLLISGVVAIWMAYNGYGVWSLVYKELIFTSLAGLQLWFYSRWIPKITFSKKKFIYHFSYGSKLLITDILSGLFQDSYKIVIGKYFSAAQLGFYTRAKSMQELPNSIIFNAINRVMFPLLAQVNDDNPRLKHIYSQIIKRVAYVMIPLLTFLEVFAKPLFIFLLTEKWIEAVPYFQILIIAALMSPLQSYNLNICKVKGRSDLVLKLSIVKYILIGLGLLTAIWFGVFGLLWSLVVVTFVEVIITAYFAGNLIHYLLREQLHDVKQPFVFSSVAGLVTFVINVYWLHDAFSEFLVLLTGLVIFVSVYLFLSHWFKNEIFKIGMILIKKKFSQNDI